MIRSSLLTTGIALAAALCLAPRTAAAQTAGAQNETREMNLRAYGELLRSDLRSQKVAIITEVMQFTDAENDKFWPIYREYEGELAKINDDRIALIRDYAANAEKMTDPIADRLAHGALDVESRRSALKAKYYERFKTAMSAITAARFLQVENQILLILDLQIAAALPIVR